MSGVVTTWTKPKLKKLSSLVAQHIAERGGVDWNVIGAEFGGMKAATIQMAYSRHAKSAGGPPTVAELLRNRVAKAVAGETNLLEATRLRQEQVALARAERELLEAVAGEKSFRSFLEQLASATVEKLPKVQPPRKVRASAGTAIEDVVQVFSDFHGGEIVTAERTRGFNEYSTRILAQRLRRVVDSHISIKQRMERGKGWKFERLHIALNGDLVSGTIHEIERHSDAKNVIMAVYAVAMVLAQAIRDFAAEYPEVIVYCTSGNHGRLPDARRMQQKDPTRNWDTMIALLAQEHLRASPHIEFNIPDSYSVGFDVRGWSFLQTHGHDVKSWNSIPWYGLNRLVGNLNALEASRARTIHYWLFAHFHSKSSLEHASGESFINGSMIGGTEFSLNALGKSDKPCQWMLMVHEEHGVTSRWPLSGVCPADSPGYTVPIVALKE